MSEHLSHFQLKHLCKIFKKLTGIHYGKEKIYLFENRLAKLVGDNREFKTYDQLIVALEKGNNGQLEEDYVNLLTTNYTYFFRESVHFRFLQYIIRDKFSDIEDLRFWSAAASGGHEAYSMAICLDSLTKSTGQSFNILGTDIAKDKIDIAKKGIYHKEEIIEHINPMVIKRYFRKDGDTYSVKEELKKHVKFAPLNIMGTYPFTKQFHIIFLRNILIYFKAEEKEIILNKISDYLSPRGYLIVSTSESLTGLKIPFKHISHSIYVHSKHLHVL